jgi:hypothetical protein
MPTSTDLVTDLPADFEVFGQAVDTQMKTNADAATQKATLTTKGDIYAASAGSTPARLAVGANDTVLTADSTTATGLKWATPASGGMTLISTTALSGTSVTLSSIPQTYQKLVMYISGATNTVAGSQILSLRINGVTTASYAYSAVVAGTATVTTNPDYTSIRMNGPTVNYSDLKNNLCVEIDNYYYGKTNAVKYYGSLESGGSPEFVTGVGGINDYDANNAAVTSLTILDSYGSRTFNGGTIYLYGVK